VSFSASSPTRLDGKRRTHAHGTEGRAPEAGETVGRAGFWVHFAVFAAVAVFATVQVVREVVRALSTATYPWYVAPLFGWAIVVAVHAALTFAGRASGEVLSPRPKIARYHPPA